MNQVLGAPTLPRTRPATSPRLRGEVAARSAAGEGASPDDAAFDEFRRAPHPDPLPAKSGEREKRRRALRHDFESQTSAKPHPRGSRLIMDARPDGEIPVLELKRLSKNFGGLRAVRDVDLKIMPGDRKAIIGPNGAGKTTLFNLITGILSSTAGEVLMFGRDVTAWPSHRRTALGMARTFQVTHLFPRLSVLDNVLLAIEGLRPSKFVMWRFQSSYREVYDKADRLLEAAGFSDRRDVEVRYLSHGEQRQLEIVLGLASDPKILLLDEPAAGLSSGESAEMTRFLGTLDPALAILLIEHDMDVVFDVADHISVLHFGEVLETGATDEIRHSARVREIYLGTG